jgi:hypothetical protein
MMMHASRNTNRPGLVLSVIAFVIVAFVSTTTTALISDTSPDITGDPGDAEYKVCVESITNCTGGCFNPDDNKNTTTINGTTTRLCAPVKPGYYSPFDNDEQFLCEPGTYSDYESAYYCFSCRPGHFAPSVGALWCDPCPPATYNTNMQSAECLACDDSLYEGEGSDGIVAIDGVDYCLSPRSSLYADVSSDSPVSAPPLSNAPTSTVVIPKDPLIDPITNGHDSNTTTVASDLIPEELPVWARALIILGILTLVVLFVICQIWDRARTPIDGSVWDEYDIPAPEPVKIKNGDEE